MPIDEMILIDEDTIIKMVGIPQAVKRNLLKPYSENRNQVAITIAFVVEDPAEGNMEGTAKLTITACNDTMLNAMLDKLGLNEFAKTTELCLYLGMRKEKTKQTKLG